MRVLPMAALACLIVAPAMAQETAPAPSLALELHALTPSDTGCLATNGLGTELRRSSFEIALFGASGGIERLVSLEFKAMPQGKTKVLQFDIGQVGCEQVSRVLINDVVACDGEWLAPAVCLGSLKTVSRLDGVEFGT